MTLFLTMLLAGAAIQAEPLPPPGAPPRPDPARMQRMAQREGDDMALLLALRPDQRPALDAFLASGRPPIREGGTGARPTPPTSGAMPTPPGFDQQLSDMEAREAEHAQRERARIAATRAFWGQLDSHQKQLFEALMRAGRGPHGPGEWDRPDHHGPGAPHGPGGPHEPGA